MKNKKPNAEQIWKQFEDLAVPRLPMSMTDRGVYSHLLRHSHLEGKRQLQFSIPWLAHGTRLCIDSARQAVRRLVEQGALRLIKRGKDGHIVEVRLPDEIRGARGNRSESRVTSWHWAEGDAGRRISCKPGVCAALFTPGSAGSAFIVYGGFPAACAVSIMSCRARRGGAIPTATWFRAAWNAIRRKEKAGRRISSAGCIANAA